MRPVTYAVDEVSLDKARKNKQNCGVGEYDMNEQEVLKVLVPKLPW